MTFPGGSGANFQIQLDFILNDKDVLARVEAETAGITDETKKAAIATGILREEVEKIAPGYIDAKKAAEAVNEQNKTMLLQARNLKAQVREANAELRIMRDNARDIDLLAKPLALGGALLVGGIFAAASKYVKDSKEATATTIAWKAAEDDAAKSGERIGAVLAKEALPVLKEGTVLLSKFAGFLEANPEVAGFALKAGLVALTLGTIGKAVSSGIRLVADFRQNAIAEQQLAAAQLQLQASNNQLEAAGIQAEAGGGKKALGGLSGTAVGGIAAGGIAAGGIAAGAIGLEAANIGASLFGTTPVKFWQDMISEEKKAVAIWAFDIGKLFGHGSEFFQAASNFLGLSKAASTPNQPPPPSFLGGDQQTQDQLVKAYESYKAADLALVQQHYDERQTIVSDALNSEKAADTAYADKLKSIADNINNAEAKLTENFNKANTDAEQNYQDQRAQIISQSGNDILKIEQNAQERIKKLREDYENKAANDRNKRDALALVQDKKDLNKGISDETSGVKKEIAQRKADTAQRLKELDIQFAKERQKRLEAYQAQLADLEQQKADESKQAAIAHTAAIKQIKEQEKQKLEQSDKAFADERKHRYSAFIAQLNDLDSYLLHDQKARKASYDQALSDLNKFVDGFNASLGSLGTNLTGQSIGGGLAGTTTTTATGGLNSITTAIQNFLNNLGIHDDGGYVGKSIARMAWNNQPEFVFSGASTKAAEQIVSGKLTQQNALGAMARGMGGSQITLNDHRRFDGQITAAERRAIQEDTKRTYSKLLAGMAA